MQALQTRPTDPVARAGAIAAKIDEAERLGAKECSPRALAKAKVSLEHVSHELKEGYYSSQWLDPDFDAANKAAQDLLSERKAAAETGRHYRCVSTPEAAPKGKPAPRDG